MTIEQLNRLSEKERDKFLDVTCHTFNENQSLEAYTEAVRDYIYLWRRICEGMKGYTLDTANTIVEHNKLAIKAKKIQRQTAVVPKSPGFFGATERLWMIFGSKTTPRQI